MEPCIIVIGIATKCASRVWILIWLEEVFSCISHVLSSAEFDYLSYLCFEYGWICLKAIEYYMVYIFFIDLIVYVGKVFS